MLAALALISTLATSGPLALAEPAAPPVRVPIVAACTAAAPADGIVAGPVLQVIDGRTLCVARGPTPDQWVRVRLSDIHDREARSALMAAAFAKTVFCGTAGRDDQGVVGRCILDGATLGQLVQSQEIHAQAASWR